MNPYAFHRAFMLTLMRALRPNFEPNGRLSLMVASLNVHKPKTVCAHLSAPKSLRPFVPEPKQPVTVFFGPGWVRLASLITY